MNMPRSSNMPAASVSQTMADAMARHPALASVLQAFEPVLGVQANFAGELADGFVAGIALPALSSVALRAAAEKLLPALEGLEPLQAHFPALDAFFLAPVNEGEQDARERMAEAILAEDRDFLGRIAEEAGLDPLLLDFVGTFVLSTVLQAITLCLALENGASIWEKGAVGQEGRCPVCGSLPSIAFLDKPGHDEKNAFLAGGGGKKHLHCGRCGANWKFQRAACPACGEQGNGVMEILYESGASHGERLDWCTKCKSYCPTLDLREREYSPNLDAAALSMMHLDMVAAAKGLRPLKPSFWNTL